MRDIKISVIIPVYNTAAYLPRCLDSILNNTHRNLEVICVNDGSRDNSLEILNDYARRDPRIIVISQENAGVSAARNRGLDAATGAYIAFVDSDDWVHIRYFEILLTAALRHDADIAVCGWKSTSAYIDDAPIDLDTLTISPLSVSTITSNDISSCCKIYRAQTIGSFRFSDQISLAEDTMFNLDVIYGHADTRLVQCECALYYYWQAYASSLMHRLPAKELSRLVVYYLSHLESAPALHVKRMFLLNSMKTLFLLRYRNSFSRDPEIEEILRPLLKQAKAELRRADWVGSATKLVYLTMAQFPIVYRLFRILNDPTMLIWEKEQRRSAKAGARDSQ